MTTVRIASEHDHGDEHAAHPIGERLDGRPRPLRLAHQLDDSRQCARLAQRRGTVSEGARPIHRAAYHLRPDDLLDGH